MYNAVVLAGSPNNGQLKNGDGALYEALIDINGRPMIGYVVDTLLISPSIDKIVVVGPEKELNLLFPSPRVTIVPQSEGAIDNLLRGLEVLPEEKKVLIATCDIPFLTPEAVEDFLHRCSQQEADLYYSIVAKQDNEAQFPGVKRTYVHLREGIFTGGNLFVVVPGAVEVGSVYARKMVELRKNPLALVKLLGYRFTLKFLLRLLSLGEVERKASALLQLNGVSVVSPYPEIGVDVDKESDLALARSLLKEG